LLTHLFAIFENREGTEAVRSLIPGDGYAWDAG